MAKFDHPYFVVEYDDGDVEDMTESEVKKFMIRDTPVENRNSIHTTSGINSSNVPHKAKRRRVSTETCSTNVQATNAFKIGIGIRSQRRSGTFSAVFAYVTAAAIFSQNDIDAGRPHIGGAATTFDPLKTPEPTNLVEALRRPDSDLWWEAWMQERGQMDLYGVYELVPVPEGKNIVDSKVVFKIKKNADGTIERYKCRLVARGFTQRYGCDFHETFAPVATSTTVRTMLAVCCQEGYHIRQLDITAAYLQGELTDHTIYMRPPKGEVAKLPDGTPAVWKLKKSVYGLKQAGIVWGRKLSKFLIKDMKYTRCDCDPCLFYKKLGSSITYVCAYVDDCIYAGNSVKMLDELKSSLQQKFGIRDMNEPNWFLGLNVKYD